MKITLERTFSVFTVCIYLLTIGKFPHCLAHEEHVGVIQEGPPGRGAFERFTINVHRARNGTEKVPPRVGPLA